MSEPGTVTAPGPHRGRSVGIVGILTLFVSVLGYLREAALASRFGVSTTMDAYFGAIFVPNVLYSILITGALSPVFIPILLHDKASEDQAKTSETFSVITTMVLLLLLVIAACGMLSARLWLPLLFAGFDAGTTLVSVRLVYIVFPAVLFLALSGILSASLNGFNRFAIPALAPAMSSIAVIVAAFVTHGPYAVYFVGAATATGFLLQALFLIPAASSLGFRYRPKVAFRHPAIQKLLLLGGPLLLYLVVANTSALLERNLASRLSAGMVSTVTYAQRLFTVPAGFLAAPLAIVAYPQFAREALREGRGELASQISRMLRLVVFLFLPITVWAILNALPVTRLLYEHGRFVLNDSILTSKVLTIYSFGILPNAATIILLRGFFAVEDTTTPLAAELVSLLCFAAGATWMTAHWGLVGLVASRTTTFFLTTLILVYILWKKKRLLANDSAFTGFLAKTIAATLAMALASWGCFHWLNPFFDSGSTLARLGIIALTLAVSAATYLAFARLFRMREAHQILETARGLLPG